MSAFASVVAVKGNGTVTAVDASGNTRVLHVGDVLQQGDTVRTSGALSEGLEPDNDVCVELIGDGALCLVTDKRGRDVIRRRSAGRPDRTCASPAGTRRTAPARTSSP